MTYVLESISQADQEKIIRDASSDPKKQRWLLNAVEQGEFAKNWAFDRIRNCYLLKMPLQARKETNDDAYFAFVDGCMYKINHEGFFGDEVYFDEQVLPVKSVLAVVESEVSQAFAVYGCWGDGPLNEQGQPEFALVPYFVKTK